MQNDISLQLLKKLADLSNIVSACVAKDPNHAVSITKWYDNERLVVGIDGNRKWYCYIDNITSCDASYPSEAICNAVSKYINVIAKGLA